MSEVDRARFEEYIGQVLAGSQPMKEYLKQSGANQTLQVHEN